MSISDRIEKLEHQAAGPRLDGVVVVGAGESESEAMKPYRRAGMDPFMLCLPGCLS